MFNEGSGIRKFLDGELFEEIRRLEGEARYEIETVLVDDGSTDKTIEQVRSTELFREREKKGLVRLVAFSKNFGNVFSIYSNIDGLNNNIFIDTVCSSSTSNGSFPFNDFAIILSFSFWTLLSINFNSLLFSTKHTPLFTAPFSVKVFFTLYPIIELSLLFFKKFAASSYEALP